MNVREQNAFGSHARVIQKLSQTSDTNEAFTLSNNWCGFGNLPRARTADNVASDGLRPSHFRYHHSHFGAALIKSLAPLALAVAPLAHLALCGSWQRS